MSDDLGADLERSTIVLFLRSFTNLKPLAQLIQDGAHAFPRKELIDYCKRRGVNVIGMPR
jgi:hypothetical protein